MSKDEDPYFIRYYSVNFDKHRNDRPDTCSRTHRAVFSPDFKYLADTYSTVSDAPVTVLRDASDGKEVMKIAEADITALKEAGWQAGGFHRSRA